MHFLTTIDLGWMIRFETRVGFVNKGEMVVDYLEIHTGSSKLGPNEKNHTDLLQLQHMQ